MLIVDGSQGEGGGQVLRTSLALALVTGQSFHITRIRAGRRRPGLMRQHLTAVRAAAEVGAAEVRGAELDSQELEFLPRTVRAGEYRFDVGSAGSTTLVFQTVLPALLLADAPSTIVLEGGTHNPYAPPFDFLQKAFLPIVNRMGPGVSGRLERPGFYPAGGGRCVFEVRPVDRLAQLDLRERGTVRGVRARALLARLPRHIGRRELETVKRLLSGWNVSGEIEEVASSAGPGNVVSVEIEAETVTEVFTAFGQRGVRAEEVAERVASEAQSYLEAGVPVGPHLCDQLMLLWALAGAGSFRTQALTPHARTNLHVIGLFLGDRLGVRELDDGSWLVQAIER